ALNIRHLTPEFLQSTYPSDWVSIYTDRRYVMFDPVVTWARFNVGVTRWSEIPAGLCKGAGLHILGHARQFVRVSHDGGQRFQRMTGAHFAR
ncbi:MAG: autoinducer binding domain-containing protein, partial [bacterium]